MSNEHYRAWQFPRPSPCSQSPSHCERYHLANGWVTISVAGGPTDDKPTLTLEPPPDPDRASSFLNIRVADIGAVYQQWRARGAQFLTPPIDRGNEIRCYMRDPDGHLIEVGQLVGRAEGDKSSPDCASGRAAADHPGSHGDEEHRQRHSSSTTARSADLPLSRYVGCRRRCASLPGAASGRSGRFPHTQQVSRARG